ncbi:hypothetical protein E4T39_02709 [Aureobasidium subglaciale]|nr:hypothetical protein E4T39_02709 [Aureobasidium subglaciale]
MAEDNPILGPDPTTRPAPNSAAERSAILPVRNIKIGDSSRYASDGIGYQPSTSTREPDTALLLLISNAINANSNYIRELGYRVQFDVGSGPPRGYGLFRGVGPDTRVYGHSTRGFFASSADLGEHFYRVIINDTAGCHCALCRMDVGLFKEVYMEKDSGPRDARGPLSPGPGHGHDHNQFPDSLVHGKVLWRD